jgi:hypothetical protein
LDAKHNDSIKFLYRSQGLYWTQNPSQYVILKNAKTIIGVFCNNSSQIVTENITNYYPIKRVAEHNHRIESFLLNEDESILWAGDFASNIVQYCIGPLNCWKKVITYSELGIRSIMSLACLGNLLFAGGNEGIICIINTADKVVVKHIDTAIRYLTTFNFCFLSPSEIYLVCIGRSPDYSNGKTDIYDVSKLRKLSVITKLFKKSKNHLNILESQIKANFYNRNINSENSGTNCKNKILIKQDSNNYLQGK